MSWRTALLAGCVAMVLGCGGGQTTPDVPEPSDEPESTEPGEGTEEPAGDDEQSGASASEGSGDKPASEFGDRPEPNPEDWNPTQGDCEDLAEHYEGLLRQVELDKLEKRKLNDKQKAASMKNVEATIQQGRDNWLKACQEIVGTIQVRERWQCAAKATTIERFNGCMDGKFDQELGD